METLLTILKRMNWRNRKIVVFTFLVLFLFGVHPACLADEFPPDVKMIKEFFEQGKIAQGTLALSDFETSNPESEHLPVLWLCAGKVQKSALEAAPYFRKIIDKHPTSSQAPIAQMELAELFYIVGNARAAAAEAKRLVEYYSNHPKVLNALILLGTIEMQTGRIGSACNRFADAAVRFNDRTESAPAFVGLGDCKYRLGNYEAAQKAYFSALEKKLPTLDQAKVFYQLGMIGQKRRRPGETRRYFLLLCKNYPHSRYAKQARTALEAIGDASSSAPLLGDQILGTLNLPKVDFSVKVGTAPTMEDAGKKAKRFIDAGHKVSFQKKGASFIILVGQFSGEMDAFIFARKLERKYGVQTDIIPLENQEQK